MAASDLPADSPAFPASPGDSPADSPVESADSAAAAPGSLSQPSAAAQATASPFFGPEGWAAEEGLLFRLRRAQVALNQLVNDQLALEASTLPQWVPLHHILTGQANTVAELARRCMVDAGAMTRLLDRLEAKALCRRVRSENDRRVVQIELTPAGKQAATSVPQALARVYNAALEGFSAEDWAQLQRLLARLAVNAEALAQRPPR